MKNKIVFLLNFAPHYREFILKKIDQELNADLYFGNIPNSSIKKLDYNELRNFKKEFKTIKLKSFYWYKGSSLLVSKPYKNFILTGDPQILSNWVILIFARLLGKRTFLWTHGWYGDEKGIKKIIKKIYFGLANNILLYGDYAKRLMIKDGFKENKLIPIYNSLNYEQQLQIRKTQYKTSIYRDHFKNDNPVLIYIGRIQKIKRLDLIISAMKLLNEKGICLNLVVIGGESKDYDIRADIKKYNLENQVWLYGSSYNEETNGTLIYNADLCVSPGNVGLTAIHSLMYGTPVITHNNFSKQMPEFETIIENYTGIFFEENNVNDLVQKIKIILNLKIERENCYRIIDEKWNPDNQIRILKNCLNDFA